mmetsp:Transcript_1532/g.2427  ORF Transcript_1532/g.2427 Transcript_1532/m.2427 type:complete len:239 (-) Transcript_1532:79-795(-)|eukprot:CAMPEP_0184528616 /NCGR_PEP_ID=MMETSP0198_2-20121128/11888_1 /TAXON_ID=1112570 /ORGANISM="Thraustochytrium sp., Strain LLF1b" /LENGTH=238 /DNA_ID=CAMNT_0026920477 /DNA_START=85 /DNA_END=801 /DNA_ORIENTATION=-
MATTMRTAMRLRAFARPMRPNAPSQRLDGSKTSRFLREGFELAPGVLYGGNPKVIKPELLCTRQKDLFRIMKERQASFEATLIRLEFEDGREQVVIPRDPTIMIPSEIPTTCNFLRYDPVKGANVKVYFLFEDLDLSAGIKRGGQFNRVLDHVYLHVTGEEIPSSIRVSVKDLDVGGKIRWADIAKDLPPTMKLVKRSSKEPKGALTICSIIGKKSLLRAAAQDSNADPKAKGKKAKK